MKVLFIGGCSDHKVHEVPLELESYRIPRPIEPVFYTLYGGPTALNTETYHRVRMVSDKESFNVFVPDGKDAGWAIGKLIDFYVK